MERSEQISDLVTALAKAQGEFAAVERNGYNPHFKSSYSTLDDIIAAVKEPLSKYGLAYLQLFGQDESGPTLTTILTHESGQFISTSVRIVVSGGGSNELQKLGSTLTYLRRYMLAPLLGVNSETDDDGNASGKTEARGAQSFPQSEKQKAAQEEKARIAQLREAVKMSWVENGRALGYLSDPPESNEWGSFYQALGDAFETIKRAGVPDGGFDKLREDGLANLRANAPQAETTEGGEEPADDEFSGVGIPPLD